MTDARIPTFRRGGMGIILLLAVWFVPNILVQNDFRTDDFYLFAVLGDRGLVWPWESGQYLNFMGFRIVSMVLFLGQLQMFGTHALGYYLVNLIMHVLATLLCYRLTQTALNQVIGRTDVVLAMLTALAVGMHADVFYNVLWISNQTETLALLLSMLYLWLMLKYLEQGKSEYGVAGLLIIAVGFFVKFTVAILPFLFLVIALIYQRAGITTVPRVRILSIAAMGIMVAIILVGIWLFNDRYDEVMLTSVLPTKLFSVVAISMICLHPSLAASVYPLLYEQRMVALAIGILLVAVSVYLYGKLDKNRRAIVPAAALIFLVAVIPRAVHQIAPRINTLQVAVLMVLMAVTLAYLRPKWATWCMAFVLIAQIAGSAFIIPEWRAETSNMRYKSLLRDEQRMAVGKSMLLVHQTVFDQYALHFYRTGRFGRDTALQVSPLRLLRKYGTRSPKEYRVQRVGDVWELEACDPRTGFMADTSVASLRWLRMAFLDPLRDYGYRRLRISVDDAPNDVRLLVERGFAYEELPR